MRGTYRLTQLFYWLIIVRFTTTCFGPIAGPSSGLSRPSLGYTTCYLLVMGVLESSPYYCVLPWYVYFFFLYIIIFLPGLIAPVFPVSMTLMVYYLTCMYKLFYFSIFSLVDCNSLLCTYSVVYCHFCVCWSALLSLGLACCLVWSGGISSVSPVIELSYFLFYLLLCRLRCLFFLYPVVRCMFHISLVFRCIGVCHFWFIVYNNIH